MENQLQYSINEVMGRFDGDKEKMHDILDLLLKNWAETCSNELAQGAEINHADGVELFIFFNRVIRHMEISFETILM